MAGKGGGSWKVAYADFVTAMMAFFLVMWIGAQDSKTRQSVANYFIDPTGVAKKPARSGAVMNSMTTGNVTSAEATDMGKGRDPYPAGEPQGPATTLVGKWISSDPKRHKAWKEKAQAVRDAAARAPEVRSRKVTAEQYTVREVSKLLQAEFVAGSPSKVSDTYMDLMMESLKEVKWDALAEDLLKY